MNLTMQNAEVVLEHLYDRLEKAVEEYSEVSVQAAEARAEYKLKWSVAFSEADGAMDLRKSLADRATYPTLLARERLEAREKSLRVLVESLRDQMGAARTVIASSRV